MHMAQGVRKRLRGHWFLAAALSCALLAAVAVVVEPSGRPARAASPDQSGGSSGSPPAPTTSAAPVNTPSAPSGLKAVFVSGGSVILSWDDPGDDSIVNYQYRIRNISTGSAYSDWTDIGGSSASTTGHTLTVTGSGRRVVQLRARNGGGPGSPASASNGPPAQMSGFATPGGTSGGVESEISELNAAAASPESAIVVSWSDPGDDSIVKYQYRLRAQGLPGGYSQWIDIPVGDLTVDSAAGTVSHTFAFLTPEMYRVRLRAVNNAGAGRALTVNFHTVWPALAAPSGLEASLSGGSVALSWDNPFDGSVYKYQYRIKTVGAANAYSSWADIVGSNADTTSATIAVTGSERRIVQLQAHRRSLGDPSSPATASTGPPAALYPAHFSAGGSAASGSYNELNAAASSPKGAIVVNWFAPSDDSILKYQYRFRAQSRPGSYSQWIDIPVGDLTVGSTAGTVNHTFVFATPEMYRVRLRAVNSAGAGGVTTFNMKPAWPALAAPSGLGATLSGSSVSLSWDNPFDGSIEKYQYRIKTVGAGNAYSSWADIVGSNADTTSATIAVTGSERRIVQLQAHRRSLGDPSSPATASTGPPAALYPAHFSAGGSAASGSYNELNAAASSPKGAIVVNWFAPSDDSILKYQYRFRAQSRPGSYSQWIDIPVGDLTVGSTAGTVNHTFVFATPEMYRVRLRAVNSAGAGGVTTFNMKPAWPALAAPSGLGATLSGSSVSLSWDNPFDDSIEKYQYRIKTVGTGNAYSSWTDIAGSNGSTTSHTITVTGSGQRDIQLRALRHDQVGGPGTSATASTTAPPTTPAPTPLLAPVRPSGFKASGGNGVIDLFWSDPGDTTINGYQYRIRPHSSRSYGEWQPIPNSGASTVSYTISNLATNEGYQILLRAGNAAGWGTYRDTGAPTGPTHSPSGVVTTPGDSSFTLTWDAPLARYGITGYLLYYFPHKSPGPFSGWTNLPTSPHSYTVTGLINGTQYRIWMRAVSAAGNSGLLTLYATPTAPAPTTTAPPPTTTAPSG